jgi:hypothetical protein
MRSMLLWKIEMATFDFHEPPPTRFQSTGYPIDNSHRPAWNSASICAAKSGS